jgi:hypothetical protein
MTVSTPGGDEQTWHFEEAPHLKGYGFVYAGKSMVFDAVVTEALGRSIVADHAAATRLVSTEAALRDAVEALRSLCDELDSASNRDDLGYIKAFMLPFARAALNRPTAAREEETNA